ncbi:MAG TPA: hypothetical protein VK125_02210 [Bacillota bacterium]|nr:hypothetical protein [Bacillota bacterium]
MSTHEHVYPHSTVPMKRGDILYSPVGRSTYFVGHTVIVGSDYLITESIPGKPSGHKLTVEQFWNRHHSGNRITLLRSDKGAEEAADWATKHIDEVNHYQVFNTNIQTIDKNYCTKWIVQAYYFGANVELFTGLNRLITPQHILCAKTLSKEALFIKK